MDKILTLLASEATETTNNSNKVTGGVSGGIESLKGADGLATTPLVGPNSIISNVINTILYVVGIAAVIMIIIGGIRYATSAGNEKTVTDAKNTIVYALIGLAAAILAYVIVGFVFANLS